MNYDFLKEQLESKEMMLSQTTKFLLDTQNKLELKNTELSIANKDIFDSINFASIIQKSLLPELNVLKIFFKDANFHINQQIGIGGDTIFVKNTKSGVVFALLDSTGHGVPAAMLSISTTLLLKEIMSTLEIDTPNVLFNLLNNQLYKTFNSNGSSIAHNEGSIVHYSSISNKLTYASAKGKVLLIRKNNEVNILPHTKKSLGDEPNTEFDQIDVLVEEGDKLVLFSDGLTDQFGGTHNKKFSRERLKTILIQNNHKSASELNDIVKNEFYSWKGPSKQTDDVSFIIIDF